MSASTMFVSPRGEPASAVFAPAAGDVAPVQDRRPRSALSAARAIPIRTVPRAAIEALVERLQARGFRHVVTAEGSSHGR